MRASPEDRNRHDQRNMVSEKRLTELGFFRQENTTDMREDTGLKRNKGYHKKEGNELFSMSIADQNRG